MKSGFIFLILFFSIERTTAQSQTTQTELIPVTYNIGGKEKRPLPRIQAKAEDSHIEIIAFSFPSLPKNFRGILIDEPKQRVRRGEITKLVALGIDNTYRDSNDSISDSKVMKPNATTFIKQKDKFLHGSNAFPYFRNQWITLGNVNGPLENDFSFRIKHFFRKPLSYRVDILPAAFAYRFPVIDPWKCEEAPMKMFAFRKMQGYGISQIRSKRYQTTERLIKRKNFDLYFKQNQTKPDQAGVQEIISYLKQNDYVIIKAEMQGAASIEGKKENNEKLQRARGVVIQQLFKSYNDNPVAEDTLVLLDNFGVFRELIRSSPYSWLDTLRNEEIQLQVNTNQTLQRKLEPYLQVQRRATLKLTMGKKISFDDQLNQFEAAMEKLMNTLARSKSTLPDVEANVMGAMDYLMELYQKEKVSEQRIEVIIKNSPNPELLYTLSGYHFLKQFDLYERKGEISKWKDFWNKSNAGHWLQRAQQNAIALADKATDRISQTKYLRMCVDFQAYSFRFEELGLINTESLCTNSYPPGVLFTSLLLHQYAFLYERSKNKEIKCFEGADKSNKRDSTVKIETALAQIHKESIGRQDVENSKSLFKPSYDSKPKSPYYELLKAFYVKGNKRVLESVEYADGGKPELNVFNLYHLVSLTVNSFDPFQNQFYDKEVQLIEMDRLISQLKKIDENICKAWVNELYMNYHLKALYYVERYFEPGNDQHTKMAESSLKFVTDYYKQRVAMVNTDLLMHVVLQLNQFNELPGTKPGAWYGFDLLSAVAAKRKLEGEELKLYAHYLKMYNVDFKPAPPKFYDHETIVRLGKESFK